MKFGEKITIFRLSLGKNLTLSDIYIESLSDRNLKNFRQFALIYPTLAKDENISVFLPVISIPLNQIQIRQPAPAEFKTLPQNLFPALQARELQNPSLSWQDSNYYQELFSTLSWTHIVELTRVEDTTKRAFYEIESIKSNWSTRELKRQINSMLYERIGNG